MIQILGLAAMRDAGVDATMDEPTPRKFAHKWASYPTSIQSATTPEPRPHMQQRPPPGASPAVTPPVSFPRSQMFLWDRTPIGSSHLLRPDAVAASICVTRTALDTLGLLTRQELAAKVRADGAYTECCLLGSAGSDPMASGARPSGASPLRAELTNFSVRAEHVAPVR